MPAANKAVLKPRKCSYCSESGHNKATCTRRKTDRKNYIAKNAKYRAFVLEALNKNGIAEGTLVRSKAKDDESLYMVTRIDWDGIQERNCHSGRPIVADPVKSEDDYTHRFRLTEMTQYMRTAEDNFYSHSDPWCECEVMSATGGEIELTPPEDWLMGASGTDKYF